MLVHLMYVLPAIPNEYVQKFEKLFEKFIWNSNKPKIALSVLKVGKEKGGLGLVDLVAKDKAIKTSWVKVISEDMEIANLAYNELNCGMHQLLWSCNLKKKDVHHIKNAKDSFWHDVLQAWCEYKFEPNLQGDQVIWYNSNIRIEDKPIFYQKCAQEGLIWVSQLYEKGQLISWKKAYTEYGLDIMQFNSIICAVPKWIRESVKVNGSTSPEQDLIGFVENKKRVSVVYKSLLSYDIHENQKVIQWQKDICVSKAEWKSAILSIRKITNVPKLRSFQYRLLHRAIVTNVHLERWKIKSSEMCSFCDIQPESYSHLFYECPDVQTIWKEYCALTNVATMPPKKDIMLSNVNEQATTVQNLLTIIVKQYIYRQRCLKKKG